MMRREWRRALSASIRWLRRWRPTRWSSWPGSWSSRTRVDLEPQLFLNHWHHLHPVAGRITDSTTLDGGLDLQADFRHATGTLTGGLTSRAERQGRDTFTYRDVLATAGGRILASAISGDAGRRHCHAWQCRGPRVSHPPSHRGRTG